MTKKYKVIGFARIRGASAIEFLVAMLALGILSLGGIQFVLIYNAKALINNATFEAARAGAVNNANVNSMRNALARNLIPLYVNSSKAGQPTYRELKVAEAFSHAEIIKQGGAIKIICPSKQAFSDKNIYIEEYIGNRKTKQIPNEHLLHKSHVRSSKSGLSLQDANILKIEVTYGYKLTVPFVNKLIVKVMRLIDRSPLHQYLYSMNPPRMPIVAQSTMRMQSNAIYNSSHHKYNVPAVKIGSTTSDGKK